MSPVEVEVRALLEQLLDPTYAGDFTDVLRLRATAANSGVDKPVRVDAQEKADALLDELAGSLAAELALLREPVAA